MCSTAVIISQYSNVVDISIIWLLLTQSHQKFTADRDYAPILLKTTFPKLPHNPGNASSLATLSSSLGFLTGAEGEHGE